MESHLQRHPLIAPADRGRSRTAARARDRHADARAAAALGLYVHVPFCARRCAYCDFSTGALSAAAVERYLSALELEAERRAGAVEGRVFTSVFFGGGTPSALSSRAFRRVWRALRSRFRIANDAEITLEANPESVGPALLDAWSEAGVNRLSMGAQSFHSDELRLLGRIHGSERPAEAVALARRHGFERLSLDLMFAFPGNTWDRLGASLEAALAIEPEHLSVYCYIPETGTPLGDAVISGSATLPSTEDQADAYALATERLARAGYECYETSNFARPGGEARHNLVYWLRREYLALGPSAHGLVNGTRYGNHYALGRWAEAIERGESPESEREEETEASAPREIMMLGLRLARGVRFHDYSARDRARLRRRYDAAFARAIATRRLESTPGGVRVPESLRFVADDVIAWIDALADRLTVDSPAQRFILSNPCPSLPSPVA
jgi:oxygen-independent coproporphyrinogen-3 oxidase